MAGKKISIQFKDLVALKPVSSEPMPDIATCGECGWRGLITECLTSQDGDWESGYYDVDDCPKCEDGGCIEYDMSPEKLIEWEEWKKKDKGSI